MWRILKPDLQSRNPNPIWDLLLLCDSLDEWPRQTSGAKPRPRLTPRSWASCPLSPSNGLPQAPHNATTRPTHGTPHVPLYGSQRYLPHDFCSVAHLRRAGRCVYGGGHVRRRGVRRRHARRPVRRCSLRSWRAPRQSYLSTTRLLVRA